MYQAIQLSQFRDERGDLLPIEACKDVPFEIKRAFCISNVKPEATRAQHANMVAKLFLVCLNGRCQLSLDNGKGLKETIPLNGDGRGICIEPKVWLQLSDFSSDCVMLVVSDHYYDRSHQICEFSEFAREVR